MKIALILFICLSFTTIISDSTHEPKLKSGMSKTEVSNFTRNTSNQEELRATPDDARALIIKAFAYIDENGAKKAFREFNDKSGQFYYKDAYIFAIDMNGNVLAHGGDNELVNTNQYYLKDSVGRYFIQDFIKVMKEKDEDWVEYKWRNYESFEIESKLTLLKRYNSDFFLGCGIYYGS